FFRFNVTAANQRVVLDSSGTEFGHTLAVWRSTDNLVAPSAMTFEYDTAALSPTLPIDGQWYALQGNLANLMPGGDTRVTKSVMTDFSNNDMIQNLGTLVANTQIVTSGADTSASGVTADYDIATLTCGAAPAANDMIFKFRSNASGGVARIAVNNPAP